MSEKNSLPAASDGATAWRRIADDLAARFARGEYESGAALPPAQDLARAYGVHRHTARQACLHLQEQGLITIKRGSGAYVTGGRLPYRIGRRVRLRENLQPFDLTVTGRIVDARREAASESLARELGLAREAPVWRIQLVNSAGDLALSASTHVICATRFPNFPDDLAEAKQSFTGAFARNGVTDYERCSTHITARLARPDEASLLGISGADPVLATHSLDVTPNGVPLQVIDGAFRADRIEMRVESE